MSRLMLANIEPGTTDDEIRDFLVKYGFPVFDAIEREEGDGSRPAALVSFLAVDTTALGQLKERIHDIHWKNRRISARVLSDRFA
ncbi:RNA-binding protein [uncultured Ramlibacter sp.]|uniref:RNA-binding protein n=1 Tax=uncultured Ramlibacter sp. TaxID=260755 RepID=UPI00261EDF3C|nr:RNA-binding protein [uncultured Ramlibacter sp.]